MPDTCGIISVHWSGVLRAAMIEAIADNGRIDDRLPPGFAHDPEALTAAVAQRLTQLRSDLQTLDPAAIAAAAARRFWVARDPVLTGQLGHLLALEHTDDTWVVRRRPAVICQLQVRDDRLFMQLGDRELDMPRTSRVPYGRLVSGMAVALSDLDDMARQLLVRRLIREGVLERIGPDTA